MIVVIGIIAAIYKFIDIPRTEFWLTQDALTKSTLLLPRVGT